MGKPAKVALLGGGLVGAGWAARLLINGVDVDVYDPDIAGAEQRMRPVLDNALRAYRKLTLSPVALKGSLRFCPEIAEAVEGAGFVQESAPESLEIKRPLLAQASRCARPDAVIASSSSGLLPSELQDGCERPERICIGHPFIPVYLMPLVEVVGGKLTSDGAKRRAAEHYRSIGMHPLIVRKEIDAFLSDRLMESVWREALHLVRDGIATADEVDQALCYGPGLRWAFMGSFLTYRVGGGAGGMRHFLEHFRPTLKLPWARFEAPEFDDELLDLIAEQSDEQAAGKSIGEIERMRDDCLVAVLQGLRSCGFAAGEVMRRYELLLSEAAHPEAWAEGSEAPAPLELHRDRARDDWVDYNGHLTESRYLQFFGDATDALLRYLGVDPAYNEAGMSYYTVETHICHLKEARAGDELRARTRVLESDAKRIRLFHEMLPAAGDDPLATAEHMMLHVDTRAGRACEARPGILRALEAVTRAHSRLARPGRAGRSISLAPRNP